MIRILIVLNGIGLDGITDSVFSYIENIGNFRNSITIGVAGAIDKNVSLRMKKIGVTIKKFPDRQKNTFRYFCALFRYFSKNKVHIVHAHGNSATLAVEMTAARLAGCQIRIAHSHNTSCTHALADRLLRPLFYRNYTHGFACGKEAGDWLFCGRPFMVIPNGQDINRFLFNSDMRKRTRVELGLCGEEIAIGHAGNFSESKNHSFVIDIFREIHRKNKHYKLFLFGDSGSEKLNIINKISHYDLGGWVSLEGYKPDLENYLCAMDIMILPSLYEGLPNVAVQFQISGLPALLSDSVTRECKVTDFVDYLPLALGAKEWADRIILMSKRNRNGEQESIKRIMARSGFDIVKNANRLSKIYDNLYRKRYENSKNYIDHYSSMRNRG